jgi:CVNH domain
MRRITMFSAAAIMAVLFTQGTTSRAQAGLPYGSYRQTCENVRLDGNTLKARCQKMDGGWRNTSLDYRACGGQVINDNGYLRCGQGGNYGGGRPPGGVQYGYGGLPPGDYKRTCQNMRMEGSKLIGYCLKIDGGWRNTSLNNVNQCKTQIVNDDGNLRCQK